MKEEYRIGELADKAGVTRRTIHYYTGRGLLPAPYGQGLGTTYGEEHYYRILLIKKLQEQYIPLDEIKKRIAGLSLDVVKQQIEATGYEQNDLVIESRTSEMPSSTHYQRIQFAHGVELNVPTDNPKAQQLARDLYEYAEQLLKRG
jgi:DNA-binding transcriptional MerR regulator